MASALLGEKPKDIEVQLLDGQRRPSSNGGHGSAPEDRVPAWTKVFHLACYFLCNVSLTLYNMMILGKVCPTHILGQCPTLG